MKPASTDSENSEDELDIELKRFAVAKNNLPVNNYE